MAKLYWEDETRGNRWFQWAEHESGLVILAIQDSDAQNPFESWDTEPPTAVRYDRNWTQYVSGHDGDPLEPLADMPDGLLTRHSAKLAKALQLDPAAFHAEALEAQSGYGGRLIDHKRDALAEALADMRSGNAGDYLEAVAAVWNVRGVTAETWISRGYSQGDYADGISVATPAWAARVGAPADSHAEQCRYAGKLYGFWAWGDCYGWSIVEPDRDPETGDVEPGTLWEAESLDSCWGYYGGDHDESGLAETAASMAEHIAKRARQRRADCLRLLIRNRVPLALRPGKLETAGAFRSAMAG